MSFSFFFRLHRAGLLSLNSASCVSATSFPWPNLCTLNVMRGQLPQLRMATWHIFYSQLSIHYIKQQLRVTWEHLTSRLPSEIILHQEFQAATLKPVRKPLLRGPEGKVRAWGVVAWASSCFLCYSQFSEAPSSFRVFFFQDLDHWLYSFPSLYIPLTISYTVKVCFFPFSCLISLSTSSRTSLILLTERVSPSVLGEEGLMWLLQSRFSRH